MIGKFGETRAAVPFRRKCSHAADTPLPVSSRIVETRGQPVNAPRCARTVARIPRKGDHRERRPARGAGPGVRAAEPHRASAEPIASGASLSCSRGGLEVIPGSYRAAGGGSRLVDHHPQETPTARAPVRDGLVPRAHLLWAAAFLLLEVITDDAPGDLDAAAPAVERDLELAEPDRVLFPALIRVAVGLVERRAGHGAAEPALVSELAGLFGEVEEAAPASAGPLWPGEPLTVSETRVLRYCRPTWARRRSPPSSTSRRTRSRPTCDTCTASSACTAAGRPCSAPGPSACSQCPPAGP